MALRAHWQPFRCLQRCAVVLCFLNLVRQTPAFSQQSYIPWTVDPRVAREPVAAEPPPGPAAPEQTAVAATDEAQANPWFVSRLFNAYFNPEEEEEEAESNTRRNLVIPWDSPPFPFADHLGPVVGYRDTSV
jgi:hypothetical protein